MLVSNLFALSGSGGSSSLLCGTCHLDRANDNLLRSSNLKTLEAEFANLDALANLQSSNVYIEMLRDLLIRSCNVNLADREVHASTVAYTLCQTNELDRNTDSERLLVVNLIEVYVKQSVCYRVELNLLEDSCV